MKRQQLFLLSLLVLVPLVVLAWLGTKIARDEQSLVQERFRQVLTEKLRDTDQTVVKYFDARRLEFIRLTDLESFEPDAIRTLIREQPRIQQLFVLDAEGRLIHPDPSGPMNDNERDFIVQTRQVLIDKDLIRAASNGHFGATSQNEVTSSRASSTRQSTGAPNTLVRKTSTSSDTPATHGWKSWYWGRGVNLIFWRRLPSGGVVGVTLERSRWMADLIGELPETTVSNFEDGPASSGRVELVDSNDQTIYQWGPFERPTDLKPFVEVPVSAPISSWRLKYYLADETLVTGPGRSAYFNLFAALTVIGIGLVGLAIYFARQYSREMRESRQRVNFVNQVSHELKTPLTNIRMYADLMEYDVQELDSGDAAKLQGRLNVIVSESQRLSRLIGNVLTFARQQSSKPTLHTRPDQIDRVVNSVIERLRPEMDEREIEVTFDAKAGNTVELDDDAVEQILLNLFSNVAKYAAVGKTMAVITQQQGGRTTIEVADRGPGIPACERENIFEPFYRLSDKIDGVAGTGIGLTIARELARIHGGDLKLLENEEGCRFRVELLTPRL